MMKVIGLLSVLLAGFAVEGQTLTVCEALEHLSDLNGKEVRIKGAWRVGDSGEDLWALQPCFEPVIYGGWKWHEAIALGPEQGASRVKTFSRWDPVYEQRIRLLSTHSKPGVVVAIFFGRLETRDHFKISRYTHLPEGYGGGFYGAGLGSGGYDVALLVFRAVDDLRAISLDTEELARMSADARSPWPIRTNKGHR